MGQAEPMRAVVCEGTGGVEVMRIGEAPDPVAGDGEVVIEVVATAVNRADLLQRQGVYPPPPGASHVLGLECSGRIAAWVPGSPAGRSATRWWPCSRVVATRSG
jgi:NADPH:quinone reductase-like Zn-dependent oxidoreductase